MTAAPPSTTPAELQSLALRVSLDGGEKYSARALASSELVKGLAEWIVRHPRADEYFVDLRHGSAQALWERRWAPPAPCTLRPLYPSEQVILQGHALLALTPTAGAFRLVVAVTTLIGDKEGALEVARRGVDTLRGTTRCNMLRLTLALCATQLGHTTEAFRALMHVAEAGTADERCNALACGAALAAEYNFPDRLEWFASGLRDEPIGKARRWLEYILRTRTYRDGRTLTLLVHARLSVALGNHLPHDFN